MMMPRVIAGTTIATIAAASIAPSIAMNVAAAEQQGGSITLMIVAIASVIAAPVCLISWPKAREARRYELVGAAWIIAALAIVFNLSNAIGISGGERDHQRENRGAQNAKVDAANRRLAQIMAKSGRLEQLAGTDTPEMWAARIGAKEADPLFARSKRCGDVTVGDSSQLCQDRADLLAKQSAATELRALETERRGIETDLRGWGSAFASVDPKVARVSALLGQAGLEISEKWTGISLDLTVALLVELMGTFLPPLAAVLIWPAWRPETAGLQVRQGAQEVEAPFYPNKVAPPEPRKVADSIQQFGEHGLMERKGGQIGATALHEAYKAWCADRGHVPENVKIFGLGMAALGFTKIREKTVTYTGIALRGTKPELRTITKS